MTTKDIKRGQAYRATSVVVAPMGKTKDRYICGPGNSFKVVRREFTGAGARFFCEVLPRDEDNGPVYVSLWASELRLLQPAL